MPQVYDISPAVYWIRKREEARKALERNDVFLSDDPIVAEWRFCNVRREDDRVTKWIADNIRAPFADHPMLWLMLCIARQINWPPTLKVLIQSPDAWPSDERFSPDRLEWVIADLQKGSDKIFTGAYIVPAPQEKGRPKSNFLAQDVIGQLWRERDKIASYLQSSVRSLQGMHSTLCRYNGWGPFLAYQAVVDMRFCPSLFGSARDVKTWCAAGPGTLRGLNRMYGQPITTNISQELAKSRLVKMWPELMEQSHVEMDLSDVPNVMCETDKFLRVKNHEGSPRARYSRGRGY